MTPSSSSAPSPKCGPIHSCQKQSNDPQVGDDSSIESEMVVGYIRLDTHKLSVLHGLDDRESSGLNSICDVSMIDGRFQDREEDGHNIEYVEINS